MNEAQRLILIVLAVFVLAGCILFILAGKRSTRESEPQKAELKINNYLLVDDNIKLFEDHAEIPLVKTLECLGFSSFWDSDETATLSYDEKKLKLSLSDKSLMDLEECNNLLVMAPGNDYFCCNIVEKDVIVDTNTMHHILRFIGLNNSVCIDYDQGIIYVLTD